MTTTAADQARALAERARRRAVLTAGYEPPEGEQISEQDVADADPSVVSEWAAQGKLGHFGVAPDKRRRR